MAETVTTDTGTSRRPLAVRLGVLALAAVLVAAMFAAGYFFAYRSLYSPSAFVTKYLNLLAAGHATDALAMPGVGVDAAALEGAGIDAYSSEALLRSAALSSLTDIHVDSEEAHGEVVAVTVSYRAGGHPKTSTFQVIRSGWTGLVPGWRFEQTPLTSIELTVLGATEFTVNGFTVDKRQIAGANVDPVAPLSLLVFTPGLYSVSVDTKISASAGTAVLADVPLHPVPVTVQTEPTADFLAVVQEKVNGFLSECAKQEVLQPTGCPFGLVVQNLIVDPPTWSIAEMPKVTIEPSGGDWILPPTQGTAHVKVEVRSYFDGSVRSRDEDVPFTIRASISVLPDGRVSIAVGGIDTR
ncbi:hypothetical protein [Microbacterium gorillae]|uniref:hypothetical protein n=1 Tax=Microbacterium gorillae TaxID=1231063 RepID=UPI001E3596E3|nr:hypothetical protein [Microbacterium gorillae]